MFHAHIYPLSFDAPPGYPAQNVPANGFTGKGILVAFRGPQSSNCWNLGVVKILQVMCSASHWPESALGIVKLVLLCMSTMLCQAAINKQYYHLTNGESLFLLPVYCAMSVDIRESLWPITACSSIWQHLLVLSLYIRVACCCCVLYMICIKLYSCALYCI